jgi:hypothetical protein
LPCLAFATSAQPNRCVHPACSLDQIQLEFHQPWFSQFNHAFSPGFRDTWLEMVMVLPGLSDSHELDRLVGLIVLVLGWFSPSDFKIFSRSADHLALTGHAEAVARHNIFNCRIVQY